MSLLSDINPADTKSSGVLFRRLLERREAELGNQVPWSIAELRLDDADLEILTQWLATGARTAIVLAEMSSWGSHLDPEKRYLDPIVSGLLLHALYAEHVRRRGSEGNYWGSIRNMDWSNVDDSRLFHSNGQPTPFHRSILEQTAQELRMRNAFGLEGTQQWFSTGYLQFGFTLKGFKNRLPEWLSYPNHATSAIEALVTEPGLKSDSFLSVWQCLRAYRSGNLGEAQVRNRLSSSPWILDEWHDDLLQSARRRMHLSGNSSSGDPFLTPTEFLTKPRLVFDEHHQPGFEVELTNLIDFDLPADSYRLMIAGKERLGIHRDAGGDLIPNSIAPIRLPWQIQQTTAQIEEVNSSRISESQPLTCWLADEQIQVFRSDGKRVEDAYAITGVKGGVFHLLYPSILTLSNCCPLSQWNAPERTWTIATIDSGEGATLLLEDEIIWSLKEARQQSQAQSDLLSRIEISLETITADNTAATARLFLPEGCELRWARSGGQEILFEKPSLTATFTITPEHLDRGIQFTLGLAADGIFYRTQLRRQIPFEGAIWFRQTKYTCDVIQVLNAWEGQASRVRISPRRQRDDEDLRNFVVTEGPALVRRVREGALTLGRLSGLGAPLHVWRNQYNESEPTLELAHSVIDGGLIHHVTITAEEISLHPAPGALLRSDFQCYGWVGSRENPMRLEKFELTEVISEEWKTWTTPNLFSDESINCIGIFFDGSCIGSWWNLKRWTFVLPHCPDHATAEAYAKVIRIFRSPILFKPIRKYVREFMQSFAGEVLSTWLSEDLTLELSSDTIATVDSSHRSDWIRAVGIIFERSRITLSLEDASLILEEFAPNLSTTNPTLQLTQSAGALSTASPLLASEVLRTWLTEFALDTLGRQKAREIRDEIARALRPSDSRLQDFFTNVIRADEYFVTLHYEAFANSWPHLPIDQKRNISALFEHDVIRKMAASERIKRISL